MTVEYKLSRRQLIQSAAILTPIAVTGCAVTSPNSELMLKADDPVARALLYYPKSKDVPSDHPLATSHQPSQKCENCVHVREEVGRGERKCPTFPGRLVNSSGWCSVWAKV
jgi:hypothetical protein